MRAQLPAVALGGAELWAATRLLLAARTPGVCLRCTLERCSSTRNGFVTAFDAWCRTRTHNSRFQSQQWIQRPVG